MGLPLILLHKLIISLKRNDLKMLFALKMYILNLLSKYIYISEVVLCILFFLYTPHCTALLGKSLLEEKLILKDSDF